MLSKKQKRSALASLELNVFLDIPTETYIQEPFGGPSIYIF